MTCACLGFGFPADLVVKEEKPALETIYTEVGSYSDLVISKDGFLPLSAYVFNRRNDIGSGLTNYKLKSGVAVTDQSVLQY